jgi:hypothetical protein
MRGPAALFVHMAMMGWVWVTDVMFVAYVAGQAGFSIAKICSMLQNLAG